MHPINIKTLVILILGTTITTTPITALFDDVTNLVEDATGGIQDTKEDVQGFSDSTTAGAAGVTNDATTAIQDLPGNAVDGAAAIPSAVVSKLSSIGEAAKDLAICLSSEDADPALCCEDPPLLSSSTSSSDGSSAAESFTSTATATPGIILDATTNLLCMSVKCLVVKGQAIYEVGSNIVAESSSSSSGGTTSTTLFENVTNNFMQFRNGIDPSSCNCISLVGACAVAQAQDATTTGSEESNIIDNNSTTTTSKAEAGVLNGIHEACGPIRECCSSGVSGNDDFNMCMAVVAAEGGLKAWENVVEIMEDTAATIVQSKKEEIINESGDLIAGGADAAAGAAVGTGLDIVDGGGNIAGQAGEAAGSAVGAAAGALQGSGAFDNTKKYSFANYIIAPMTVFLFLL